MKPRLCACSPCTSECARDLSSSMVKSGRSSGAFAPAAFGAWSWGLAMPASLLGRDGGAAAADRVRQAGGRTAELLAVRRLHVEAGIVAGKILDDFRPALAARGLLVAR